MVLVTGPTPAAGPGADVDAAPDGSAPAPRGDAHVQSLARGLAVIEAFDAENEAMTLSDVARRTDLTRATARRFLLTLVDLGYVRTDGRLFSLTPQVLRLGYSYLSSMGLPEIAQPHLESLSAQVHESSSMAVLDGTDIVYVARVATRRIMRVGIAVGTRFPAWATSMGRVLLAALPAAEADALLAESDLQAFTPRSTTDRRALRDELERVREQGWSLVDQELEQGLRSIAATVLDARGQVVAAINISTQVHTGSEDLTETLLSALLDTARAITHDQRATRP